MTEIIIEGNGSDEQKARVEQIANDYVAAVNSGEISAETNPDTIILNVSDFPDPEGSDFNGRTTGSNIDIDVDETTTSGGANNFETTTLHELVHVFNPSLHETGLNDETVNHSADFYEKVDADAAVLNMDPGYSGTEHPNYDPELLNPDSNTGTNEESDGSSPPPLRPETEAESTESSSNTDGGKGSTSDSSSSSTSTSSSGSNETSSSSNSSGKPIVVDLDGDGVETTSLDESGALFDFDDDGFREKTAWVGADDGLLVFDVGSDGQVTEAKEIAFALWTEDESDTDLEGLRTVFDSNNDGQLNAEDDDWSGFRIWQDKNQNGISEDGEFLTLEEAGIQSIGLEHKEGTGVVHEDGTVNHGMIDIQMSDGSVNEGGDIAFAFEDNGQREAIDADGNIVIEYESDTFVFANANEGFTVTDYDNFVTRIHNMGITETAVSALQYAQQSGVDVVFDFGDEMLTLEDVSLEQLTIDLQSFADDLLVA